MSPLQRLVLERLRAIRLQQAGAAAVILAAAALAILAVGRHATTRSTCLLEARDRMYEALGVTPLDELPSFRDLDARLQGLVQECMDRED